ncbi:MAG TPA: BMP family ABC transporter substrate-binding protein [Candidatus Limnocylindria bacterium]|nr:BMP family ABC transporter substrate-binding protein [Candidatus Limnocylindria bacterium]
MRIQRRYSMLAVIVSGAFVLGACGTASPTVTNDTKIGVVTDVGTVNDKNFNEYTFVGAKDGAAAIGAAEPQVTVPNDSSEYEAGLQAYIDQGYDIVVTAGFNLGVATTQAAHDNPDVWFIGVDQGPPCVTAEGLPDTSFACEGDAAELLPKYVAISFQEDQAGYLAGMAAATASETGVLGAIGGITLCGPCIRYMQGFKLGAESVNPDVQIVTDFVTESDFTMAFNDPVTGTSFAEQFLQENPDVDVLFQVAGKTGNGILDAACEAGIYGIGVDVDQALSYPNAAECIITSAAKSLALAVATNIQKIEDGTMAGGDDHWDASRDGVGYAPFHDNADVFPEGFAAQLDEALAQIAAGDLQTCPDPGCGSLDAL